MILQLLTSDSTAACRDLPGIFLGGKLSVITRVSKGDVVLNSCFLIRKSRLILFLTKKLDPGIPRVGFSYISLQALNIMVFDLRFGFRMLRSLRDSF